MRLSYRRSLWEGATLGLVAGAVFAMVQVLLSTATGGTVDDPFRYFASVLVRQRALETGDVTAAMFVGTAVHLTLSAVFGLVYGALNTTTRDSTKEDPWRQIGIGALFGAALWFVDVQLFGRALFPWFSAWSTAAQAAVHMVGFGAALGVMYAWSERRARGVRYVHLQR